MDRDSERAITGEYLAHHPRSFDVRLRDGRRARIRPLVVGDRAEIARALGRMSSQSRYFRFHRVVERLTDAELAPLYVREDSAYGDLLTLGPVLRLSATPCRWALPTRTVTGS